MAHMRTQIRTAVVLALTGLALTGPRVYINRLDPVPDDALPALKVETNAEQVDSPDLGGDYQERDIQLLVIGLAKATANLDNVLDQIALEVEQALLDPVDKTFGGLVESITYTGLRIGFTADLEKPAAEVRLAFLVRYATTAGDPTTPA